MATTVTQLSLSVSALLAFQRLAGISMLPAHLRIRPQLVRVAGQDLPVTDEEHAVLVDAGLYDGTEVDPDAATMIRALVSPDAELDMTLGAPGRDDTYVCLVRRHRLLVAAMRCADEVTIDAYLGYNEHDLTTLLADTVRGYLFGPDGEVTSAPIPRTRFCAADAQAAMSEAETFESSLTFATKLKTHGVPEVVAEALYRAELQPLGRAEVSAYLNHEGARSEPDNIVQITNCAAGAVMTMCARDSNGMF